MAIAGGVMLGLSGLCTGVAVSYYAAVVVQDFYVAGGMSANGLNAQGNFIKYFLLILPKNIDMTRINGIGACLGLFL